tara:strand:+ start:150 stop:500 length:351 start_codon:yes stop_codon:yes gene_type:complete
MVQVQVLVQFSLDMEAVVAVDGPLELMEMMVVMVVQVVAAVVASVHLDLVDQAAIMVMMAAIIIIQHLDTDLVVEVVQVMLVKTVQHQNLEMVVLESKHQQHSIIPNHHLAQMVVE